MSTEFTSRAGDGALDDAPATLITRRAPRISQADVFRAADELLVHGDRPTIDRVRMRLGRGSPNTINEHLDAWWMKLDSRLRDLPGRQFPELPERVGQALQHLWNEALDGAHEAIQESFERREQSLIQSEQTLEARARDLDRREQSAAWRAAALEESLALAREQLASFTQRNDRLEVTLQERDAEGARLRARIEALDAEVAHGRAKLEASTASHQAERTRLEERHAAAEAHWLTELDRARQHAKSQERQLKDLQGQSSDLRRQQDVLAQELLSARAELKTALAVREQLEARLGESARVADETIKAIQAKRKTQRRRNPGRSQQPR